MSGEVQHTKSSVLYNLYSIMYVFYSIYSVYSLYNPSYLLISFLYLLIYLLISFSPYIPLNPSLHFVPAPRTRLRTLVLPLSSSSYHFFFFLPSFNSSFRPFLPPSLSIYLPPFASFFQQQLGVAVNRVEAPAFLFRPRLERGPLPTPFSPLLAISRPFPLFPLE